MIKAMEYFLQRPGPYYPNAEFFMQKMFEYKGWIYFDESTGKFESFLLVPEEIEKKFPHLKDPVWNDRFNLDDPWWKSSSKWFPPRNLPDVSAGEVWAGGWLQDAERPAPVLIPFRALGLFRNLNLVPQPNGVQKAARHLRLAA